MFADVAPGNSRAPRPRWCTVSTRSRRPPARVDSGASRRFRSLGAGSGHKPASPKRYVAAAAINGTVRLSPSEAARVHDLVLGSSAPPRRGAELVPWRHSAVWQLEVALVELSHVRVDGPSKKPRPGAPNGADTRTCARRAWAKRAREVPVGLRAAIQILRWRRHAAAAVGRPEQLGAGPAAREPGLLPQLRRQVIVSSSPSAKRETR
jgi:hypothetical protein